MEASELGEAKMIVFAHTFVAEDLPLREMLLLAILLPASVVRLVRPEALTNGRLQHAQVTPTLVVLETRTHNVTMATRMVNS